MATTTSASPVPAVSQDTLFDGSLVCAQHVQGYRFSIDAILAAHFCTPPPEGRILDLGAGNGIIGLILAHRHARVTVVGLEIQASLAALARLNIAANDLQERFSCVTGDLRVIDRWVGVESFDLVVANPPFYPGDCGRQSHNEESRLARHEVAASLEDFIRAARFSLKNGGKVVLVHRGDQCDRLLPALVQQRLIPKRLRPVYSYPGAKAARMVLVAARKNGGMGCVLEPPLYIYAHKQGPYSVEVQAMYRSVRTGLARQRGRC